MHKRGAVAAARDRDADRADGVEAAHFRPMGQALIETMRAALGDDFPEGAAEAWEAAYDLLADEMIRRADLEG